MHAITINKRGHEFRRAGKGIRGILEGGKGEMLSL